MTRRTIPEPLDCSIAPQDGRSLAEARAKIAAAQAGQLTTTPRRRSRRCGCGRVVSALRWRGRCGKCQAEARKAYKRDRERARRRGVGDVDK